ncbi:hypothetical protein K469DRAFT_140241 [Zopfia rhizophila CBS 207.26]|uniref:Uncharacterized protein n=1 Tax=Zopfia rhizophila CBS 207.26 TaxID=1314779 RepID=A0A6A6E5W1_9PEZI|nr:hypothetical protein K469DRAFT_140241 [Zopfia rhizophila CBS 207.26]
MRSRIFLACRAPVQALPQAATLTPPTLTYLYTLNATPDAPIIIGPGPKGTKSRNTHHWQHIYRATLIWYALTAIPSKSMTARISSSIPVNRHRRTVNCI